MKDVLWSQKIATNESDYVVVNGELLICNPQNYKNDSTAILHSGRFKTVSKHVNNLKTSNEFWMKIKPGWTYVQGNFQEKDKSNRYRVYIFACDSQIPHKVLSTLKKDSSILNCTLYKEDTKVIIKVLIINIIVKILCLIILLLLLFSLL